MNICIWKTYNFKWCYFFIWLKMEKNPQLRFPKNGIFYGKKIWVTFYCCFFRFFSKNCQKVKVTNLTKNGQNYQFFLEICFLSSLDTIWWIFYHGFVFMNFCDMRNRRHKIEIWAKNFFLTTRFIAENIFQQ